MRFSNSITQVATFVAESVRLRLISRKLKVCATKSHQSLGRRISYPLLPLKDTILGRKGCIIEKKVKKNEF